MLKKTLPAALAAILLLSTAAQAQQTKEAELAVNGKLWSSLWQQKAAEYRALCFQAYNIAHWRVDQMVAKSPVKPLAIVTDIDETLLDNSPNSVHQALLGKDYEKAAWMEWTAKSAADTVPGAPSFLKYAASKGITIFYVTNREESERAATLKNLQRYGFPNADDAHLMLRKTSSSKEDRRQEVAKTHEIMLLLGDTLADFSSLFDHRTVDERLKVTAEQSTLFGKLFIILPNANYGDWETSLYGYDYKLTPEQKEELFKKALKTE